MFAHSSLDRLLIKCKVMKKIFIGIDFSKKKIAVTLKMPSVSPQPSRPPHAEFSNSKAGYVSLVRWVGRECGISDTSLWLFCGENTGGYSRMLSDWLYGRGYDLWIENALVIKRAYPMKRMKDDRGDSEMIADYAMRFHDVAQLYEPACEALSALRELFLYRHMVVRHRCSFEVRRSEKRLTQAKSGAKRMISLSSKHVITELNKVIAKCDEQIRETIASDDTLREIYDIITSMPGVGTVNAVCMMVYTNNFKDFGHDARKICCYYGVAPFAHESGTSVRGATAVHYMANRTIKALLSQTALVAIRRSPEMARYYRRLVDRGKKHAVALNNVKAKIITIVTAMVRRKEKYNPDNGNRMAAEIC